MSGDSSSDLNEVEQTLRARLAELKEAQDRSAESRKPVELDQPSVGRLSRMDAMQHQAMAQANARQRVIDIQKIEAALRRIQSGEYGECVSCGEEIAAKRLDVDPAAPTCIECARRVEESR